MIRKVSHIFVLTYLFFAFPVWAADSAVFELNVDRPISQVYPSVYNSLEDVRFYVVFEPDIGSNVSSFAKRWGDDYNRNNLTAIRSMVFCNPWYANQVSNKDPRMLGLCPLHLTLYEKEGKTTVLFNRPTVVAAGSPAYEILKEVEQKVINAIEKGVQ